MHVFIPVLILLITFPAEAEEVAAFHFDKNGAHQPAGWPDLPAKIWVIAGKPVSLHFPGVATDWKPVVQVHRITSARRLRLQAEDAQPAAIGWQWNWTPPTARGPAHYEIRFDGTPSYVVRVETRDPEWLKDTLEMLRNQVVWNAVALTAEEHDALTAHGLRLERSAIGGKGEIASLQLISQQSGGARRRVVWDEEDPNLLVWHAGSASGDTEVRAPRWWISPKSLASDTGLIRFLDLFSESPRNP